jgi:uncharacterized protein
MKHFLLPLLGLFTLLAAQPPSYPEPVGWVNDFAGVIPDEDEAKLTELSQELEAKTTAELTIATLPSIGDETIDMYAVELFTRWGVGKKGKENGVLIVMGMKEREVWIEVGYGLEGPLPDGFVGQVYRQVLRPRFQEGKYGEGLYEAAMVLARRIGDESGVEITGARSAPELKSPRPIGSILGSILGFLFLFFILTRLGPLGLLFLPLGRRGYWSGGAFGGSGGFGGGFGGFGGGACGGGGAGGGW